MWRIAWKMSGRARWKKGDALVWKKGIVGQVVFVECPRGARTRAECTRYGTARRSDGQYGRGGWAGPGRGVFTDGKTGWRREWKRDAAAAVASVTQCQTWSCSWSAFWLC